MGGTREEVGTGELGVGGYGEEGELDAVVAPDHLAGVLVVHHEGVAVHVVFQSSHFETELLVLVTCDALVELLVDLPDYTLDGRLCRCDQLHLHCYFQFYTLLHHFQNVLHFLRDDLLFEWF